MIDAYYEGSIYSHDRQSRLQKEAEHERLARSAGAEHHLSARLLTATGDVFIAVGTKLKQRSKMDAMRANLKHLESAHQMPLGKKRM